MERFASQFVSAWRTLPADQQMLSAGAAMLALGFAILFWTPLGNRPVARYCFGLAVLCHLLMWGMAKQFGLMSGPVMSTAAAASPAVDIALEATDPDSTASNADPQPDALQAAVLDPRDRSAPLPVPKLPIRGEDETPIKTMPQQMLAAKAPELAKSPVEQAATLTPLPNQTKEEPTFEPAPAVDIARRTKQTEAREPPVPTTTPRLQENRLAVAPDDPLAERRVLKHKESVPDAVDWKPRPAEIGASSSSNDVEFTPAQVPEDRPQREAKVSENRLSKEIDRLVQKSRHETPLAGAAKTEVAAAIPIPKATTPPSTEIVRAPTPLQGSSRATNIDADLAGSFAPTPAPLDANASGGGRSKAGPTMQRKVGPAGDLSGQRSTDNRKELLERFGGNTATEEAVSMALAWLAAHQDRTGKWDCDGFMTQCPDDDKCEGKAIEKDSDVGVTAIALLAFLGAGHTHRSEGPYRETVRRALSWLLQEQAEDGDLQGKERQGRVYSHATATLALTEAYQMTADERMKPYCQKAIDWLVRAQHPELGGWRYAPRIDSDTSVYGWAVLALASGRQAGLQVPDSCWTKAQTWLPQVSSGASGGLACYQPGRTPSAAMTAEALVCRQLFGLSRVNDTTTEAVIYLLERSPSSSDPNIYYWYYGTVAMFQVGGPQWERWNEAMQKAVLRGQRQSGHQRGSWDPGHPWGVDGGRVFSTATNALCLEVYYRHLPIYKETSEAR